MALGRGLELSRVFVDSPSKRGKATVFLLYLCGSAWMCTGEVHGGIQGRYKEGTLSPVHLRPPCGKAAGVERRYHEVSLMFGLSEGALGRLKPIHLKGFDARGHRGRRRSGPELVAGSKLVSGSYRICR